MLTLQVASRIEEAAGIAGLVLTDPQGVPLPEWVPGAHIDVHIERSGQPPLIRQYSLCGDPSDRGAYRIAVLREDDGEGGSVQLHESIRQGSLVQVSQPRDLFGFTMHERIVFVAGGIGITPILPMILAAEQAGADWELHYAGRERASMAFTEMLSAFGERVHWYVSAEGRRMALPVVVASAGSGRLYACGPERLLGALEAEADAAGVTLQVERFANANIVATEADHPFEVELSLTGTTITVNPGESILDRVASVGVPAPSSCKSGTCGTCETFVLEGEPDHRDAVLNAREREESEVMMICVSRCKGKRLVLEL